MRPTFLQLSSAILCMLLAMPLSAQQVPDFSGQWQRADGQRHRQRLGRCDHRDAGGLAPAGRVRLVRGERSAAAAEIRLRPRRT